MKVKNNWLSAAISFVFALYIILSSHNIYGSYSVGDILMLGLIILHIITRRKFNFEKNIFIFWFYITLQTLILIALNRPYAATIPTVNKYIKLSIMFVIAQALIEYVDIKKFYKVYFVVVVISMIGIAFQSIEVYILNRPMTILIPFSQYAAKDQVLLQSTKRPSAFFLEPQHFASFVLPMLILELRNGKYFFSGLITASVFLSSSTQGIVCCAIIWFLYFIVFGKKQIKSKIIMTFFIAVIIWLTLYTDMFYTAINKIQSGTFTNNIRIYRAFEVYMKMPFSDKLTGIGMKNINNYLIFSGVCNKWIMSEYSAAHNFISTIGGNFVEFGLIGGIGYLLMLFNMFIRAEKTGRVLVIIIFISAFSQTIAYNVWFVFYWVMFYMFISEDKVEMMKWSAHE